MTFGDDFSNYTSKDLLFIISGLYVYSGLVSGWYTLNRITPQVFLFLPLLGWIIYFIAKLFLSFAVGFVMLPVRTFRNIKKINQLNKINI
ncbi:MAG: hypothetical protein JXR51_10495 [Bacteroidales bacterium]|nr:hypothetical protein [Bacteroidales bacterium]MBN2757595.1 hypothetical protein [Bacteroidales bacterium]